MNFVTYLLFFKYFKYYIFIYENKQKIYNNKKDKILSLKFFVCFLKKSKLNLFSQRVI